MIAGGLDKRVQFRRRNTWATASNKIKKVRAPGQRIVAHYVKKRQAGAKTPYYYGHKRIPGVKAVRNNRVGSTDKRVRTVHRAYGGVLTHDILRERICRAFLVEEQRIVKQLLMSKKKAAAPAKKGKKKGSKRS